MHEVTAAVIVGTVFLAILFKPIFGTRAEFFECLEHALRPDILSLFRGRALDDLLAEFKLTIWLGAAGVCAYLTYAGLTAGAE